MFDIREESVLTSTETASVGEGAENSIHAGHGLVGAGGDPP
jgi:hypothetical protein